MIKIKINEKSVEAGENQTILAVAKANGIPIPHLCYHPALKPSGACKLCGVQVKTPAGRKVVMLACILKAKPGLEIETRSDLVAAHREKAFAGLLQMAPDSRRIRTLAAQFNVPVPPQPGGCIQCRLCVRVCSQIVGAKALKMVKTDTGRRVVPQSGQCIGCGTCANLCPTHIITVTDQDNVRTVSIKDETIGRLPLERCEGCGKRYTTAKFLKHVEQRTSVHPDTKTHHNFCPVCIKLLSDRAQTEKGKIKK